jgi:hypothetical protein
LPISNQLAEFVAHTQRILIKHAEWIPIRTYTLIGEVHRYMYWLAAAISWARAHTFLNEERMAQNMWRSIQRLRNNAYRKVR